MKLYAIRHKKTGKLMPLFEHNRGYSFWNPEEDEYGPLDVPRFLPSLRSARACVTLWAQGQFFNKWDEFAEGNYTSVKPCGRTKDMLEIVTVYLRFQ